MGIKAVIGLKQGKCVQRDLNDEQSSVLYGKKLGNKVDGGALGLEGYEFEITGGSDYCGFPMRKGILGARKKLVIYGGIGFRGDAKGIKMKKTVCGHKIHDKISQINLKITKQGNQKLDEIFPRKPKEEKKA